MIVKTVALVIANTDEINTNAKTAVLGIVNMVNSNIDAETAA